MTRVSQEARIWGILLAAIAAIALYIFSGISASSFLVSLAALILVPIFILYPKWAFFILIFLRPILDYFGSRINFAINPTLTISLAGAVGIFIFVWGGLYLLQQRVRIYALPYLIPFIALVAFDALSLAYSRFPSETLIETVRVADYIVIAGLAFSIARNAVAFRRLLYTVLLSAIVPILVATYQLLTSTGLADEVRANRLFGTFTHPNFFAYFLAIIVVVLVALIIADRARQTWQWWVALAIVVPFLFLTYTRGAMLIAVAATGLFLALHYGWRFIRVGAIIGLGLGILVAAVLLLEQTTHLGISDLPLVQRFTTLDSSSGNNSLSFRFSLWQQMLPTAEENLVIGHGAGTFRSLASREINIDLEAHNDYLKIVTELGLIGLVLYVAYLVTLILTMLRSFAKSEGDARIFAAAGLALATSLAVMSFFDNIYQSTALYWVFLAVVTGITMQAKTRAQE